MAPFYHLKSIIFSIKRRRIKAKISSTFLFSDMKYTHTTHVSQRFIHEKHVYLRYGYKYMHELNYYIDS